MSVFSFCIWYLVYIQIFLSSRNVLSSNFVSLLQDPVQDCASPLFVICLFRFPLIWQFLGFPCHDIGIFKECHKLLGICKVLTNWNYFHYCNFISPFPLSIKFSLFSVSLIVLSVIILRLLYNVIFISLVLYCWTFLLFLIVSVWQVPFGRTSLYINIQCNFLFCLHLSIFFKYL